MTIEYATAEQFYAGIKELVMAGLTFRAYADRLTIILLGGF